MSGVTAGFSALDDVHASVIAMRGVADVGIKFVSESGSSLYMFGDIDLALGLLTDALAQIDAITAQRSES